MIGCKKRKPRQTAAELSGNGTLQTLRNLLSVLSLRSQPLAHGRPADRSLTRPEMGRAPVPGYRPVRSMGLESLRQGIRRRAHEVDKFVGGPAAGAAPAPLQVGVGYELPRARGIDAHGLSMTVVTAHNNRVIPRAFPGHFASGRAALWDSNRSGFATVVNQQMRPEPRPGGGMAGWLGRLS